MSRKSTVLMLVIAIVVLSLSSSSKSAVEGRYLPTRGVMDRLDKLKELLKELLESEIEKEENQMDAPPRWHPEHKLFYKRNAN